ncbi:MAG: transcription termination factor Rho [Lachnospiraceae bacterium]|nr:transcription termination factor Rho [Lachnospiraceae bacterium]
MRERLQKLSVAEIRALAREKKIKDLYSMKKAELIEALAAAYEEEQKAGASAPGHQADAGNAAAADSGTSASEKQAEQQTGQQTPASGNQNRTGWKESAPNDGKDESQPERPSAARQFSDRQFTPGRQPASGRNATSGRSSSYGGTSSAGRNMTPGRQPSSGRMPQNSFRTGNNSGMQQNGQRPGNYGGSSQNSQRSGNYGGSQQNSQRSGNYGGSQQNNQRPANNAGRTFRTPAPRPSSEPYETSGNRDNGSRTGHNYPENSPRDNGSRTGYGYPDGNTRDNSLRTGYDYPESSPQDNTRDDYENRDGRITDTGYPGNAEPASSSEPGYDYQKDPENYYSRDPENSYSRTAGNSYSRNPENPYYQNAETAETSYEPSKNLKDLDSGDKAAGILEVMPDGFGFLRSNGYLPGEDDVYVAPSQIRKFNLKTGDIVTGSKRIKGPAEKFSALLFIDSVNGLSAASRSRLTAFENLTPVFPHDRLHLEYDKGELSLRIVDLLCPVGKGQRGMIVAQPKVGKTTLLKQIAHALLANHPELHLIVLLIDERPEEVTDMKETVQGENVEVVYSTFDELPEHHKRVSEMVIERAKRLVEMKKDVVILLDSITRLTRAYNITVTPSGRTLSGGLDPAALYMPKRFFGAARAMREGGSLTILATALVDTGSRLDDVVYEEFKGTGNMELVLDRKLSEHRIFPAIDILKTSTRRDDLLLTPSEQEAVSRIHAMTSGQRQDEATEQVLNLFALTKTNAEFIARLERIVF